jgi:hypothetical protein
MLSDHAGPILARCASCCAVVPARTRCRNRCCWETFTSIRSGLVIDMAGILRVGSLISPSASLATHRYWLLTRRSATMTLMAAPPASTKTSLQQRLSAHARTHWPQLAGVTVRFRGEDAVVPTGAFAGLPEDALDCAAGLYLGDPTL